MSATTRSAPPSSRAERSFSRCRSSASSVAMPRQYDTGLKNETICNSGGRKSPSLQVVPDPLRDPCHIGIREVGEDREREGLLEATLRDRELPRPHSQQFLVVGKQVERLE